MKKLWLWIKTKRLEFIVLFIVVTLSAFLRLYKIDEYMLFLGDEGRDMVTVRRLLVNRDLVFVGPGTSVGSMYLGPVYYYLIAPFLWLFNFSPVGPSVEVALFGVATVFLVWLVVEQLFGPKEKKINIGAISAALLYATAPVIIIYSRSSWNPNVMPFFALVVIYSIWKVWYEKKYRWLMLTGLGMGVVLQSHYLGLLLIPTTVFFWLLSFANVLKSRQRKNIGGFVSMSLVMILGFLVLMSPLIAFDLRHQWRNLKSIETFFVGGETNLLSDSVKIISTAQNLFRDLNFRFLAAKKESFMLLTNAVLIILLGIFLLIKKETYRRRKMAAYFLLVVWVLLGVLGLSFYSREVYDHYLGFLFPAPFILIGALINETATFKKSLGIIIAVFIILLLTAVNLYFSPIKDSPNRQLERSIRVADKIIEEAKGESFNLAVISDSNYEGAYQYFLELRGAKLLFIDPQRYEETRAEQLFVVCEYVDQDKCHPTSNPKSEVANFGWSKIKESWEVSGLILYKLVPNYSTLK